MIRQGLTPVEVANVLGHTDANITLKVYARLFDKPDLAAPDPVGAVGCSDAHGRLRPSRRAPNASVRAWWFELTTVEVRGDGPLAVLSPLARTEKVSYGATRD